MVFFSQKIYFWLIINSFQEGGLEKISRGRLFLLSYIQIMCRIENVVDINKFFSLAYNMSGGKIKVRL